MDLVVGVDAGGTATRAVVTTLSGEVLGRGSAGVGNPLTVGFRAAADAMEGALRAALGTLPPADVVQGVLGIAGTSCLTGGAGLRAYEKVWEGLGLAAPMDVVGDVVTAFASGSAEPSGIVLIAGTGAIAAQVEGLTVVHTVDGHGWLLGDAGSGRWIGLAALRSAVRQWSSPFAASIATRVGAVSPEALVAWAQHLPFTEIDALAPLVCELARNADPQARAITSSAATELIRSLDDLAAPGPVVLAGSLLTQDTPVREEVRSILRARDVGTSTGADPTLGAARLAAGKLC
ncbi:N-acetylglucosamine kinase [Actinoplanes sp. M2I2]|uniref:N-acetylglucosamine kinase n=1 Tax=Actinoplanes sp. M2I2 TaxID=1734444 RepID=UPI002021351F|nr:BadF/BadG/BcrA/BcrD ATPase family protein [Actinoplanes sp. M2I2]